MQEAERKRGKVSIEISLVKLITISVKVVSINAYCVALENKTLLADFMIPILYILLTVGA